MSPEEERPEKSPEEDDELELVPLEEEEPPEEKAPLELEVLPDEDAPSAPIVVPRAEDEPEEEEAEREDAGRPGEEEEAEPPPDPPTLVPLEWNRILIWPFQGSTGSGFFGMLLLAMFFLAFGWVLSAIPLGIGAVLRILAAAFVGHYLFGYARHVVLAAMEGSPEPPALSVASDERSALRDGFRGLALAGAYALPATVVLFLTQPGPLEERGLFSTALALPFLLAGWFFFPASFLIASVTGRIDRAGPTSALALAKRGGLRYVLCLVPGAVLITSRHLFPHRHFVSVVLEVVLMLAIVHTSYMLGLLVRESEPVTEYLLEIGREGTESPAAEEEDPEDADPPEEEE